jgi:hypothetical protein
VRLRARFAPLTDESAEAYQTNKGCVKKIRRRPSLGGGDVIPALLDNGIVPELESITSLDCPCVYPVQAAPVYVPLALEIAAFLVSTAAIMLGCCGLHALETAWRA